MRKWKARLREATLDEKTYGSQRERKASAEIDAYLGGRDTTGRPRKWLPLDVIVLGWGPATSLLIRRLQEVTVADTELTKTQEQPSNFHDGRNPQKSMIGLESYTGKDDGDVGRPFRVEGCVLAHVVRELLAIRSSSPEIRSSQVTDVDLVAASYLLRSVSLSFDRASGSSCAKVMDASGSPTLQSRAGQPSIQSTMVTAPQNLAYSLHSLPINHDPKARYIAPYLCTVRYTLITIDLASAANTDPLTKQPRISTLLELSKSVVQVCKANNPYGRFDIFLAFLNIEHLEQQLRLAEEKLDPDSFIDCEPHVHRPAPPDLKTTQSSATYQYLTSLFADVNPQEVASLPTPPATEPPHHLSPACRATLHYILCRFFSIHDFHDIRIFPCLVDASNDVSLRKLLILINDVVISRNVTVVSCFGTGPLSPGDYGPAPGRFNV